jgi:DNA-binding transcriptional MerR regulator
MEHIQQEGGSPTEALKRQGVVLLSDSDLASIESASPNGLTSRELIDIFVARGIRFSEATLRKYVQLGLLPRSVRVGCKGKHLGSKGIYPSTIVRRVNQVRALMAANYTIEEIRRSFARFKEEINLVEKNLRDLLDGFEKETKASSLEEERKAAIEAEIVEAKHAAGDLVRKIASVEASLSAGGESASAGTAVGGGSDLF